MIHKLTGNIDSLENDIIILDVQGVGYGLQAAHEDLARALPGAAMSFYVHEHIRDDAHDLYGFSSRDTLKLFKQLISVKNVGPKVALAVLGIGNAAHVRQALADGDVKLLQSAKGVGKRAAEQMVVELRDKVGLVAGEQAEQVVSRGGVNVSDEAMQGLLALGYSEADAQAALHTVDPSLPTEVRIKQALQS